MDDDTVCCEWCGEEFTPEEMATAEICHDCVEVVEDGDW